VGASLQIDREHGEKQAVYEYLAYQVDREDGLINHRLSWTLQLNGFLFAAVALLGGSQIDEHVKRLVLRVVPIAGVAVSTAGLSGVIAANFAIRDLKKGWYALNDKYLYVRLREIGEMSGGKVYVIALPAGKSLPALPPSGIKSAEDFRGLNVVSVIDMTGLSIFAPGPNPSTYAYSRVTVQRNLFRIPLNWQARRKGTWLEGAILAFFGRATRNGGKPFWQKVDRRRGRDEVRDLSASLIPLSTIDDQDADSRASWCLSVVLSCNKDEETGVHGYRVALATRTTFVLAVHKDRVGIASTIRGVTPSIFLSSCQRVRLNKAAPPRMVKKTQSSWNSNLQLSMDSTRMDFSDWKTACAWRIDTVASFRAM
jgi:hypothetical protein